MAADVLRSHCQFLAFNYLKENFSPERVADMHEQHLEYLFSSNQIEKAAALCPTYLGKDESLWERWIARFNGLNKLQLLLPYIPLSEPRLPLPYSLLAEACR